MPSPVKICTICSIEYPATPEYFHVCKKGRFGVRSICKRCSHDYNVSRAESIKEYNKQYHEHHSIERSLKRQLLKKGKEKTPQQEKELEIQRFWSHVLVGTIGDCWTWKLRLVRGYGTFNIKGKNVQAHRYAWELHFGAIPDGLLVLHKCDNRSCVNPSHLFLGTHQDNMDDMIIKHRENPPIGERSGTAKLTAIDVQAIRSFYKQGTYTQSALAKLFDVDPSTISAIVHRKLWRHIE